jgi:serine/threonine protein kinase/tetratricopeptide (TPR) repeat protein
LIGKTLAHYEITGLLGKGGMGEVYRAHDTRLKRDVALKILPADLASDPVRLERFEREAQTLASLNHPHIVTIYSVEEDAGVRFLTMESIEGRSLEEVLAQDDLPVAEVLKIGLGVADALAAAHAKGIVHRDLKPANVMLTADGRVKVLDFGLAKAQGIDSATPAGEDDKTRAMSLTRHGTLLGTMAYMSPEQLRGQPADARSDVFALGILLYELSTRQQPFTGESMLDITSSILRDTPTPLADIRAEVPPALADVVQRCMEKDPDRRYADAKALASDLGRVDEERRSASRSASSRSRDGSPAGFGGTKTRVALVGVVLLAAALAVWKLKPTKPESTIHTIAVLPFDNVGGDEENAFFADGVHADVLTRLGRLGDLRVISGTSVRRFRGADDLREVGRRLGADYVMEGSVRRWEDRVRVSANLVDASTDASVWSGSFDGKLVDVLDVQAHIAQEITSAMGTRVSTSERAGLESAPKVVMAAYDDYLRARNALSAPWLQYDDLQKASTLLENAVSLDPDFVEGWAVLARTQSQLVTKIREFDGRQDDAAAMAARARASLSRAQTLAPDGASSLKAQGYYEYSVEENPVAALRDLDRALELSPSDAEILLYQSIIYEQLAQPDEAIDVLEKAYELDSANTLVVYGLTVAYEMARRYADMVPFFERLLELEPGKTHYEVQARYYDFLARGSLAAFHRFEEAVRTVPRTEQCDVRSVKNDEMIVAMVNDDFPRYAADWKGKWDRHHRGHGNWSCPAQINDEANQARLLQRFGDPAMADSILVQAQASTTRPFTEMSLCIFDRATYQPKLDYLSGDPDLARSEFNEAVVRVMSDHSFPRSLTEREVLLETADLVAPDRVYDLFRDFADDPLSLVSMESVCADPWTFPNLLADPRFRAEVKKDGRFVEFLEHYGATIDR